MTSPNHQSQSVPIGSPMPRVDGYAKVCGNERYAADEYPDDLVYTSVVRSPHAHARILSIDTDAAKACPGIIAVLTHRDIQGTNRVSLPEMDQPVLADEKVRFIGEPVVLILAEKRDFLPAACAAVQISYESLPAVFDLHTSLDSDTPVIHENRKDKNLLMSATISRGDILSGFAKCAAIAEGTFILPRQEHAYLETEAGVARIGEDGILEMIVSTQTPFRDAREISDALGIAAEKVRVIAPYLGGGFGGKDGITVQGLLGLGALHSGGRPVKIWNSREESFISSSKRHPGEVTVKIGCLHDGTLNAMSCRLLYDTGAYAGLGGPVLVHGLNHASGVYRVPNCTAEGVSVYTNNPVSSAFRGFGLIQIMAGIEQVIDMLADKVGIDPVKFRLLNAVREGDTTGPGVLMSQSTGIIPCLQMIQEHPLWMNQDMWVKQAPSNKRRGVGAAAAVSGIGYGPVISDYAGAKIQLLPDGKIKIYAGVVDMGQGNNPTNVHIAGDILNQDPGRFELVQPDTFLGLPSCSAAASRTTYTYGNALILAAHRLKDIILDTVCKENPGTVHDALSLVPGGVIHSPDGQFFSLETIAFYLSESERVVTKTWTAPVNQQSFPVTDMVKMFGFPNLVYSFTAHLAMVEIDEITGMVTIHAYIACTDAGRILNPQVYEQQVQGAVVQGIGYALFEDFQVSHGVTTTRNLSTYIIPTAMDVPDITSLTVETYEQTGPYGLKGVGEIGIAAPLPCISNAIARAIGKRIYHSPITPERILSACREV